LIALFRWPLGLLALCAVLPTFSPAWWIEEALALLLVLLGPLLIAASAIAWRHRNRGSGYYVCAWGPVILLGMTRGFQLIQHRPQPEWLEFAIPAALAYASLVLAIGLAEDTLSIRQERDAAHRLAERDALTGLLNRRAILARLRAAIAHARESGEPMSLLFIDIDHFKQINDSYGHHAGDRCLRAVIAPIASELSQGDALGRYGGEEFLVVLTGAGSANAEIVAERIRSRVEKMPILVASQRIDLTLSIGVAAMDGDALSPEQLIERADAALYRAKSSGRNLVMRHAPPPRPAGAMDN
jgi:diguanylate cyclase (GGDEF)-like protein